MKIFLAAFAVSVVAVGCGLGGNTEKPWDKNKDGLVGACEGLSQNGCAATAGCKGEQLVCLAICRADGNGGCLPCEPFTCVESSPPAPPSCESLPASSCAADSRCELLSPNAEDARLTDCVAVCIDKGDGGCESACSTPPPQQPVCVTKPVSNGCEQIPAVICNFVSACKVEHVTVCEAWATDIAVSDAGSFAPKGPPEAPGCGGGGGGGTCTSYDVCVPRSPVTPPANKCATLSADACAASPECEFGPCAPCVAPEGGACPAVCAATCVPRVFSGGSSGGGAAPAPSDRCVAGDSCSSCLSMPGCNWTGARCASSCLQDVACFGPGNPASPSCL